MNDWKITAFVGVGPLRFGMMRSDAREELGAGFTTFKKTPVSGNDTDAYSELAIHLYYDGGNRLDFVEFVSRKALAVTFDGISPFTGQYHDVVKAIAVLGHRPTEDGAGCYFPALEISIYAPREDDIASVGVFAREKFDRYCRLKEGIEEKRRLRRERRS